MAALEVQEPVVAEVGVRPEVRRRPHARRARGQRPEGGVRSREEGDERVVADAPGAERVHGDRSRHRATEPGGDLPGGQQRARQAGVRVAQRPVRGNGLYDRRPRHDGGGRSDLGVADRPGRRRGPVGHEDPDQVVGAEDQAVPEGEHHDERDAAPAYVRPPTSAQARLAIEPTDRGAPGGSGFGSHGEGPRSVPQVRGRG